MKAIWNLIAIAVFAGLVAACGPKDATTEGVSDAPVQAPVVHDEGGTTGEGPANVTLNDDDLTVDVVPVGSASGQR